MKPYVRSQNAIMYIIYPARKHDVEPFDRITSLTESYNPVMKFYTERSIAFAKAKAVALHATKALGGRGGIAPTHSRPWH
jgi:hypothetical protein